MSLSEAPPPEPLLCEWIEPGLNEIPGQDPLGLQTITTDRILPGLLPGVLALSRRARYFSIYAFLLKRYQDKRLPANNASLDEFIRKREFELAVAANLCQNPECNASGAIGNSVARPLAEARPAEYERQLSILTTLGGYGLYYRSPMEELGIVALANKGTIGDEPIAVDSLHRTPRALRLAEEFERSIEQTRWFKDYLHSVDPIPSDVLEELAQSSCLCRLGEHPDEREAIRNALLIEPNTERREPTQKRRGAFALLLDQMDEQPAVAASDSAFRNQLIISYERSDARSGAKATTQDQWAAMIMRECLQDSISTIWLAFCRAGLTTQPYEGCTADQLRALIKDQLFADGTVLIGEATVSASPDDNARAWLASLQTASNGLEWEELRGLVATSESGLAGLAVLIVLAARVPNENETAPEWELVARADGESQPGLRSLVTILNRQLDSERSVLELLEWFVLRFIVAIHETVAMAKLPNSTFRFYWEHGRLRFVDNGVWRFDPSGLRREALAQVSRDLGWWDADENGTAHVTDDGRALIQEVFA